MLQQPLLQLYLISSCDLTAIAFKQDELCFHVLICYQEFFENGETTIVSCKNCHNFITKRFQKKVLFGCLYNFMSFGSLIEVPVLLVLLKFCSHTDRTPDYSNPMLHLRGRGLMNTEICHSTLLKSVINDLGLIDQQQFIFNEQCTCIYMLFVFIPTIQPSIESEKAESVS